MQKIKCSKRYEEKNLIIIEGNTPQALPVFLIPTHISTPAGAHWDILEGAVYMLTGH